MKSYLVRSDAINSALEEMYKNQFPDSLVSTFDINFVKNKDKKEIIDSWLYPLMSLIYSAIMNESDAAVICSIYIGERVHRPFSFYVGSKRKSEYFSLVCKNDIKIYQSVFGNHELISKFHDFDAVLNAPDTLKILTIGDCLFSQVNALNAVRSATSGFHLDSYEHYFGAFGNEDWDVDVINASTFSDVDFIAISPFTYWGLPPFRMLMKEIWSGNEDYSYLERFYYSLIGNLFSLISEIRNHFKGILFIHNCSGLPWLIDEVTLDYHPWNLEGLCKNKPLAERFIQRVNHEIDLYILKETRVFLIDERKIVAQKGRKSCASNLVHLELMKISVFHYDNFAFYLSDNYISIIKSIFFMRNKKLIFSDFDNTLWHGVMADGSVVHFHDRQLLLQKLSDLGIILVAVSKNHLYNIRWSEMSLFYDSFSLLKINFESKSLNITRAAKQLNISLDQCIFIDDSPEEMLFVSQHLPQVTVMDSRQEQTWKTLDVLYRTLDKSATNLSRRVMYADKIKRDDVLSSEVDTQENLYSMLNLSVSVKVNDPGDIARAYELIIRTNQFSSSKKLTLQALRAILISENTYLYSFHARDKFGDMGIVGVVVTSVIEKVCVVEEFSLSCRAMGFSIEDYMMSYIKENTLVEAFKFSFVKTSKNTAVESFLSRIGFASEVDQKHLCCRKKDLNVIYPAWISPC